PPFAQNGTVVNLRMSTRFCTKGDGFQFLAKFAILPQNANSQNYKKCFIRERKKSKVIRVGYRGKMFYLSDLLLHVIGFG
ncbi:hypothetical protein J8780_09640, partial [Klebsiella pneumoniae]